MTPRTAEELEQAIQAHQEGRYEPDPDDATVIDERPLLPTLARPSWCARCEGPAPQGRTYCDRCLPLAQQDRRRAMLREAYESLPGSFSWCHVGAPMLRDTVGPRMIDSALAALTKVRLVLSGPPGAGKTSLSIALMRYVLDEASKPNASVEAFSRAVTARFVDAFAVAEVRAESPLGRGEPAALRSWKVAALLVIDDVAAEPKNTHATFGELVHYRHAQGLQTIFTTGFVKDQLSERYGSGITRRLIDQATVLVLGPRKKLEVAK